ncbi:MAG TPA: DUF5684 domain-containing protein [Gemmatimonadales bacterium]
MQDTYASSGPGLVFWIVCLVLIIFEIASYWRVYQKAGKPGWASIIPIYNAIVLLEIVGRPWWWILLWLIPLVNIVVGIIVILDLAKSFGKGVGFALGIIFLTFIFIPVLAWGDAQYQGPPPRSL